MSLFAVSVRRFSILFYAGMTLAGLGALLAAGLFFMAVRDLPQVPAPLGRIIETPPTEIFAATGERLMIIGGREFVPLNRISPFFIQAVVATEDHRFWEHHGLDKLRTLKALWITLFESRGLQPSPSSLPRICFLAIGEPICVNSGNCWSPCKLKPNIASVKS
jgi:penicillin-binding protein 1A